MKKKWVLLLVLTLLAAGTAVLGLAGPTGTSFAWGLAAGTGIASAYAWFAERSAAG